MSSPRVQKIYEAMPNQFRRLGKYDINFREALRWQGRVSAATNGHEGKDAAVIDLDSLTWATLNKRILIVATPASDRNNTAALKTQSHAQGHFLDGSVSFDVYMESFIEPFGANAANLAYFKWYQEVQQHILGQLASPVTFHFSDNTVEPTLDGVNGATSSATYTDTETVIPYGIVYPGGV